MTTELQNKTMDLSTIIEEFNIYPLEYIEKEILSDIDSIEVVSPEQIQNKSPYSLRREIKQGSQLLIQKTDTTTSMNLQELYNQLPTLLHQQLCIHPYKQISQDNLVLGLSMNDENSLTESPNRSLDITLPDTNHFEDYLEVVKTDLEFMNKNRIPNQKIIEICDISDHLATLKIHKDLFIEINRYGATPKWSIYLYAISHSLQCIKILDKDDDYYTLTVMPREIPTKHNRLQILSILLPQIKLYCNQCDSTSITISGDLIPRCTNCENTPEPLTEEELPLYDTLDTIQQKWNTYYNTNNTNKSTKKRATHIEQLTPLNEQDDNPIYLQNPNNLRNPEKQQLLYTSSSEDTLFIPLNPDEGELKYTDEFVNEAYYCYRCAKHVGDCTSYRIHDVGVLYNEYVFQSPACICKSCKEQLEKEFYSMITDKTLQTQLLAKNI